MADDPPREHHRRRVDVHNLADALQGKNDGTVRAAVLEAERLVGGSHSFARKVADADFSAYTDLHKALMKVEETFFYKTGGFDKDSVYKEGSRRVAEAKVALARVETEIQEQRAVLEKLGLFTEKRMKREVYKV